MSRSYEIVRSVVSIAPIFITGTVIHGFKRGSRLLGTPTANIQYDESDPNLASIETGVYFGWAELENVVYKTVINIGYSPTFGNTHITIEAHLVKEFGYDFYDHTLKLLICGKLRKEAKLASLNDLIEVINGDKAVACEQLDLEPFVGYSKSDFFV